jgi:hypothetical protein
MKPTLMEDEKQREAHFRKLGDSRLSWFQRGLRKPLCLAELGRPLPSVGPPVVQI